MSSESTCVSGDVRYGGMGKKDYRTDMEEIIECRPRFVPNGRLFRTQAPLGGTDDVCDGDS